MIAKRDRVATFNAWQTGNAFLTDFVKMILESNMHIICTMRSKTEYGSETNEKGRLQYKRIGLAPIQKDNLEFEFDIFAEMDHEHHMIFQKSLCRKLSGKVLAMNEEGQAKKLVTLLQKWMDGAPATQPAPASKSQPVQPEPDHTTASQSQTAQTTPPARNSLETKKEIAIKWAERLQLNKPLVEEMNEATLDDKISQYKQEYQQRQQNAKAEAATREELMNAKK